MTGETTTLSAAKQKALLQCLRGELSMWSAEPTIQPMPPGSVAPLSSAQEQIWRHSLSEDARRPFDLSAGPLLRALLIQMRDEVYRLAIAARDISALFAAAVGHPEQRVS